MTAVVFTAGQPASAAALNQVANAADAASTAAAGMADSATAAALSAQHASDQAVVATTAATNTTSFATAAASNAAAAAVSATAAAANAASASGMVNVGRNKIHNPQFLISQRGIGLWTTPAVYTLDRWLIGASGGSRSVSQGFPNDTDRAQIGDEEVQTCLSYAFTGGAGAGDFEIVQQRIENIRRFGGKTITVSFWAKSNSGSPKLGINTQQVFGTGGSPSALVFGAAQAVTLNATWAHYSVTFTLGSISGKVLGTNGDSFLELDFWFSAGATWNTGSGGIGVQSNTVFLWGVQLEIGSVATALEKLDYQTDLANCQRFYQTANYKLFGWAGGVGQASDYLQPFMVYMRSNPIVNFTPNTQINATATVGQFGNQAVDVIATASGVGAFGISGTFTASADL